jgi:DNA repair protein RecO (recombination protein O)
MGVVSTKAIVISSIKYGDSSLIVKLYTHELGLISCMIKGVLKSKKGKLKAAYFQPLTLLVTVISYQEKRNLQSIREAHVQHLYQTVHSDIIKQSVAMFLSEVLSSSIQEEESNTLLYEYLENSLLWLDSHDSISNFHLVFLLNLTKFLGFYPDTSNADKQAFHLQEGTFTEESSEKEIISGDEVLLLKTLLGIKFDAIESINFSKNQRQTLLRMLIRYFELHLHGFKNPRSLGVLEAVFSR